MHERELVQTVISPWLSVEDGTRAVEFYAAAFGAVERERLAEAGRVVVANMAIDGADFWLQENPDNSPADGKSGPVRSGPDDLDGSSIGHDLVDMFGVLTHRIDSVPDRGGALPACLRSVARRPLT
jgi:uncharacterized glyoxalase superfamily protein PhnB